MDDNTGGNTAASSPATFAEADWSPDASPASDPSQQSGDATAAVQPTTASEPTTPADDKRSPIVSRDRFDEVNTKYNELKAWKEQNAWVEDAQKRAAFEQAVQIGQMYSTDRVGYIRTLLAEAINDPQLSPAIRSEAARLLGTRQQQAQPEPVQLVPVQLEDGTIVQMPRDPQAWAAQLRQQWEADLDKKYAPALSAAEKLQKAEQRYQEEQQAKQFADGFGPELAKRPHFAELKDEIIARLSQAQLASDHPAEVRAAALAIYADLVSEKVLPNLSSQAQSKLLDNLQHKAQATTGVNPGGAAPSTSRKVTKFTDLGPEAW